MPGPDSAVSGRAQRPSSYSAAPARTQSAYGSAGSAARRPQSSPYRSTSPSQRGAYSGAYASARTQASYGSTLPQSSQQRSYAQTRSAAGSAGRKSKKKTSPIKVLAIILSSMLGVVLLGLGGLYFYVSGMLNAGNESVVNNLAVETPPELTADQMNILVLGLDYTESDSGEVQRDKENPQADMILYVQYDKKAQTIEMLQVPRDSYMGEDFNTGGTGKINAVYKHGPHTDNKIQNIVEVFNEVFQLPVDHWVTIDMESLRSMVDVFGGGTGIPVNIPYDIVEYDDNGNVAYQLPAGVHNLKGYDLEFFLRARKAEGMNRGDIDRLDNQKIFYSALFNYMRTMSWQEMVKLMPFFLQYIETDINPLECAALGVSVMNVPNENVLMGTLPCILNQGAYYGKSLVVPIPPQEAADFLNAHFRPAEVPVGVEMLNIAILNGITGPVVPGEMKRVSDNGTVEDQPDSVPAESTSATDAA